MSTGNIRRAQLVAPFGVGAMMVLADGTGVLAAGLDHWFERSSGDNDGIDEEEFHIGEWRLEAALGVEGFRAPPDWRWNTFGSKDEINNLRLSVPFLRFPTWHFCRFCKTLRALTLDYPEIPRCGHCAKPGKKGPSIAQVPFVAVCDYGHLQDFPFREWVHGSVNPTCSGDLTLRGTGAASLSAQVVECRKCKQSRNMSRITEGKPATARTPASSYLTDALADNEEYLCRGISAWHGTSTGRGCDQPLRGSLRAAANVYYSLVRSAIFLPREQQIAPKLLEILSTSPLGPAIALLKDVYGIAAGPDELRQVKGGGARLLSPYSDDEIRVALDALAVEAADEEPDRMDEEWNETAFREPEYRALVARHDTPDLKIRIPEDSYSGICGTHLEAPRLVERLRETRALYGFSRINADTRYGTSDRKGLLRLRPVPHGWLPAYVVNGEGLLLRLDPARLQGWENRREVLDRARSLADQYEAARLQRQLRERDVTARFVLVHTFSHLVMNQLTFDCGYSSASLRERLFVSEEMASVLIYTAAGDSEGTMGGLVRMGKPGTLESVIEQALENASWCSSDPICMESGDLGGQGPDSCNLAACHSCCLVPETACEEFNRFLDRGLVQGTRASPDLGYFSGASAELIS